VRAVVMGHDCTGLAFAGFVGVDVEGIEGHADVAEGLEARVVEHHDGGEPEM
jgi:hypothetical protein